MNSYPLPNLAYTRTYRFGMDQIAKLSHLANLLRMDQSAIVRDAIDEYFERHADDKPEEMEAHRMATSTD